MNPNTMLGAAPQRLVHDVAPPRLATAMPTTPMSAPQPAPVAQPVTAPPAVTQTPQPMFPVEASTAPTPAPPAPQPAAQAPIAPTEHPQPRPQAEHHHKSKTNWLVIGLAILVTAGLALAAYMALRTPS